MYTLHSLFGRAQFYSYTRFGSIVYSYTYVHNAVVVFILFECCCLLPFRPLACRPRGGLLVNSSSELRNLCDGKKKKIVYKSIL